MRDPGADVVATVDLGPVRQVREISMRCLHQMRSWIMVPQEVRGSADGVNWTLFARPTSGISDRDDRTLVHAFGTKLDAGIRYVRVSAVSYGKLPEWHLGAGVDSWIFADELVVR